MPSIYIHGKDLLNQHTSLVYGAPRVWPYGGPWEKKMAINLTKEAVSPEAEAFTQF